MKYILLIVMAGFIFGCDGIEKPKPPKNLIPKAKMVDILSESYLTNAARSISSKDIREKGLRLDSIIYKKFEIDSLQFATSNNFYSADLDVYAAIFEKVEQKIRLTKERADSLKEKNDKILPGEDSDSVTGVPTLGEPLAPQADQEEDE